ncbi:MAG: DUF192 domain-containing protein [Bdellovibrionales bacterium]
MTQRFAVFSLLLLVLILPMNAVRAMDPFMFDHLEIKTQDGKLYDFNIELALTQEQHARGMMYRTYMAENAGMLFLFGDERMRSFWMKDTLIPLDIIFIRHDGEIHHIHHSAKPQDETGITSKHPSMAVLEIKGGMADDLGIKDGDIVIHPAFKNVLSNRKD